MPRVSDAYLAARRQQILEAAWRCFARNGFHSTSMQDIFEESGLSAGAVYRYFPGKVDIVRATAAAISQGIGEVFDVLDASEPVVPPDRAFRMVVDGLLSIVDAADVDRSRIAIHVWSEAVSDQQVGAVAHDVGLRVRQRWVAVASRWRAAGYLAEEADPEDVARLMYGMMVGFIVERHVVGDVTGEQYMAGFTALFRLGHARRT